MKRTRHSELIQITLLVLLTLALRLIRLDAVPIRGDEAFTIQYWPLSFPDALTLVGTDPHPWGAYALVAIWRGVLGSGEWVMRLLPVLLSLPGAVAIYRVGQRLFAGRRAGFTAAMLYALHPFLIWHAQDVRNYAIWVSASTVAMWAFWLAVTHNQRRDWIRYGGATIVAMYLFFLQPFMVLAQAGYVLVAQRDRLRRWFVTMLATGIVLIPWVVELYTATTSDYGGTAGRLEVQRLITWFLPTLMTGNTLPAAWFPALGWGFLVLLVLCAVIVYRSPRRNAALFLLSGLLIPVITLSVAALRMEIFRPRYIIAIVPYLLLLPAGTAHLVARRNRLAGGAALTLLAVLLMFNSWVAGNLFTNPAYAKAPDWRSLTLYLEANAGPNDLIVIQTVDPAFSYYYDGQAADTGMSPYGDTTIDEDIALLDSALTSYRSIWIIPEGDQFEPLRWLRDRTQQTAIYSVRGLQTMELRPWSVPPEEAAAEIYASFEDTADLLDWQITRLDAQTLRLLLYWRPTAPAESPIHGFAHLTGPPQPDTGWLIWTQDDHRVSGTHWEPGQIRRDVYTITLPPGLPDGDWALNIGLYNPETLDRVPVNGDDHLTLPLDSETIAAW